MLPTELFKLRSLSHLGLVCKVQVSPLPQGRSCLGQDTGGKHSAPPWRVSSSGIRSKSTLRVQVMATWVHQVLQGDLGTSPETEPLVQAP